MRGKKPKERKNYILRTENGTKVITKVNKLRATAGLPLLAAK